MKFKFSIRSLLIVTLLIGCAAAFASQQQSRLANLIAIVLFVNLIGAGVAVTITKVFRFPLHGGYRNPPQEEDCDSKTAP